MRSSIRTRLTIAFIGVSLIPLLLVGLVLSLQSFNVQSQQALSFQHEVTLRVSTQVGAFVNRLENQLTNLVKDLRGQSLDRQATLMANMPSYPRVFQLLVLLGADGTELIKLDRLNVVGAGDLGSRATNPEFLVPRTTKNIYYSPVGFDPITGEPSMWISVPMINPHTGDVDGVVASNIRFKEVWDLIASVEVTGGESVYITGVDNRVIAHLNPSVVLRDTKYTPPADGIYTKGGLDTPAVVIAANKLTFGDQVFNIVAEKNLFEALALAIQTIIITVVLLIVAIAIASVEGLVVARQITRPIQVLAGVADTLAVEAENFDPLVLSDVVHRTDEFGQLARVFQNMGQQVVRREETLKKQVRELRIEIDEGQKRRAVAMIVESDAFRDLQAKAAEMRRRHHAPRTATATHAEIPAAGTSSEEPSESKE